MGPSIWQLIIILVIVFIPLLCLKLSAKSSAKWKEKICEFRDLAGLVNVIKISVGVYIVTAIASLWFTWSQVELLERIASGASITEGEAATDHTRQELIGGVHIVVSLINAIIFLRWTYLANKNARSFNATDMKYSPAWSVGWHFVPILGLWKPYQALKEIFKASHPDYIEGWQNAPRPAVMPFWWGLWVISGAFGHATWGTTISDQSLEELFASSWLAFGSHALDVALGFTVISMVKILQDWQILKHQRLILTEDAT